MKDYRYTRLDQNKSDNELRDPRRNSKTKLIIAIMILQFVIILLNYFNWIGVEVPVERSAANGPNLTCGIERTGGGTPTLEYEVQRRRVESVIAEMWKYVRSEATMSKDALALLKEHKNALLSDMDKLRLNDGFDDWRLREILELENIVQGRIKHLQNPSDCNSARKVACKLDPCGFGCQVHQIAICLIISYATGRTMVLETGDEYIYGNQKWEEVFQPFSETCKSINGGTHGKWADHHLNATDPVQVIHIPVTNSIKPPPQYIMTLAVPEDLSARLIRVHGDPGVWWIGQFLKYVLRFQPNTQRIVEEREQRIQLNNGPIVGIHVRRTDKVWEGEAKYHSLEEFMTEVEEFYDQMDFRNAGVKTKRRVYIASDDPTVLNEAKGKYPKYTILGFEDVVASAKLKNRYTTSGLDGIILDTHILSKCDFIVCTHSSNICRLVYELRSVDNTVWAFNPVMSVDSNYHVISPMRRYQQAVIGHKARNGKEANLVAGALVWDESDHADRSKGMKVGIDVSTKKKWLYPAFKLNKYVSVGNFPKY